MSKRRKIHEVDHTNDIRYRGPLNYRHFRIAAWVFIALAQISVLINVAELLEPGSMTDLTALATVLSFLKDIATPLLLIANFAVILTARENYSKLLLRFGILSFAAFALFFLLCERYAVGIISLAGTREKARATLEAALGGDGFFSFNIFLDLFLCTLVMFFLNYTPKKRFAGKKLPVFRLFALIPILYEAASVTLKILASFGKVRLPLYLFPLLTTKPPVEFVVFIALALFIKRRERKFLKQGKSMEEYHAFLDTKVNSWHFSVHAAVIMAVAAIVDFILATAMTAIYAIQYYNTPDYTQAVTIGVMRALGCGIGASTVLIFVAPLMLLFSYTRKPRHPELDYLIPAGGVFLIVLVYLEGIYQTIIRFV